MTDLQDLLSQSSLFSKPDLPVMQQFVEKAVHKNLSSESFLTMEGDLWPYLFLLADGKLTAVKQSSEGRTLVITEMFPGEVFWGLAFFEVDLPNPMSIQANRASSVYLWKRESVLDLMIENGRMIWELSRLMVDRMLHASSVIEGLAFQPVAGRLAGLLTRIDGAQTENPVERILTLDEMAARIGTTREMVSRILHRFSEEKIINITRTDFRITDKGKLERYINIRK
ncbi:Crp/Fnr family transcriptional regulator [Chloroflexota bacterium]